MSEGPLSYGAFSYLDPGELVDGELRLFLARTYVHRFDQQFAPAYEFTMHRGGTPAVAGDIRLRIGNGEELDTYFGHVGFNVAPSARGHHLAERATRLLFPLARRHGLRALWITANPDNIPSRRTCERLGGTLIDIVPLPVGNPMYVRGEREKCRYRIPLD